MITEQQLDTWAKQGSVTQSKATCDTVRGALSKPDAPYAGKSHSTFLQGSYANDTNIYADSDVDIVIKLDAIFYRDLSALDEAQQRAYMSNATSASYSYDQFKQEVTAQLKKSFGAAVTPGKKAIFIQSNGARRDADVLPATQHRKYTYFASASDNRYVEGICFWLPDGTKIVNYPKQHSANCTAKHQATNGWFKPAVRIMKNMRNAMAARNLIADGLAPSYFLEGMLYNVPNPLFGGSYRETIAKALGWLHQCERGKLVCANEQYYLLHDSSPVTWRRDRLEAFLGGATGFFMK